MSEILRVTMLGTLSLSMGENLIDEHKNRQRKVWLLLAYLIYSRNSRVTQDNYLSVVQGAGFSESEDPMGKLKALFYRARTMLNPLYENAGHELIVYKNSAYGWNCDIPLELDIEVFDGLCKKAKSAQSPDEKFEYLKQAFAIYKGDFLQKFSTEPWVMPITAYYHQQYLNIADFVLSYLESNQRYQEAVPMCRTALSVEPYSENLYQHLMRCLLGIGDKDGVIKVYEDMGKLLFDTFGVMPCEESHRLYSEATKVTNDKEVPIGAVKDQLTERGGKGGAVLCEYNYFMFLYRVKAREIVRKEENVHIALLSLNGKQDAYSKRSLNLAMENFEEILLDNLRLGDVISKCSVSQYIVMLPGADAENSGKVCKRVIKAFNKKYPHSPFAISWSVQHLEPKE